MCVILIGLTNMQHIISRKILFITLGERDWAADNRTRVMLFPSLSFLWRQDDECVFKSFEALADEIKNEHLPRHFWGQTKVGL